jgi:transcriptional regulator of aromatic amino acid metabolism
MQFCSKKLKSNSTSLATMADPALICGGGRGIGSFHLPQCFHPASPEMSSGFLIMASSSMDDKRMEQICRIHMIMYLAVLKNLRDND